MSKRCGTDSEFNLYPLAKKSKLETGIETINVKNNNLCCGNDDIWGDDFNEDEMVREVDLIVSQKSFQETSDVKKKVNSNVRSFQEPSTSHFKLPSNNYLPSVKKHSTTNNQESSCKNTFISSAHSLQKFKSSECLTRLQNKTFVETTNTQILAGSNTIQTDFNHSISNINYEEFCKNQNSNSTQKISHQAVIDQDTMTNDHKRMRLLEENRNLLADLREKQGETEYLRKRLKKIEDQVDKERRDKEEQLKKQESKHNCDLIALTKEKEEMKTQFELQRFELETLNERFKLLESGNIKLTQPRASVSDASIKGKMNISNTRLDAKHDDFNNSIKENLKLPVCDKIKLRVQINDFPLKNIPESIYESSCPEKTVVKIEINEKSGRRNLPILQEDDNLRIFENPELVKPLVTMIGNEELKINFFLPDLTRLISKSEKEINSIGMIPIINKLVATTSELILNSTKVLQKISDVMTNDDIRDMNDIYFSKVYKTAVYHSKSIFDGTSWHEEERGIEARRSLGVLSHVALKSTYLSEYIGGKTLLKTDDDDSYKKYINYMTSYNSWPLKNADHEFLQLLLKFVTAVRLVRRAHQFTGLLTSVAITLINAQNRVPFEESGIHFALKIFKEIVLSRPLQQCFIPLCHIIEVFGKSSLFAKELCKTSKKSTQIFQHIIHYKFDACVLEMFLKQLQYFKLDPIMTIKIVDALLSFLYLALCKRIVDRKSENCPITDLLHYIVKLLCDCLSIDTNALKNLSRGNACTHSLSSRWYNSVPDDWINLSDEFWEEIKFLQFNTLKKGIRFFNYLMTHESSTFRLLDSEVRLSTFLEEILKIPDLTLGENEKEAISDLKKDFKQYNPTLNQEEVENKIRLEMQKALYKKR